MTAPPKQVWRELVSRSYGASVLFSKLFIHMLIQMVVALTLTLRYVPDEIPRHGGKFLGRMYLRGRA